MNRGENLKCFFNEIYYEYYGQLFTCNVVSIENFFDNVTIDGFIQSYGSVSHDNGRKVQKIGFEYKKNLTYIPKILGFSENLLFLRIVSSNLVEIKTENFIGMQKLKFLQLIENKLTSVPSNAFTMLTQLREIQIIYNEIQEIPNQIFSNNLNLEKIYLYENKIEHIDFPLFKGLTKLRIINLNNNQIEELPNELFLDNVNLKEIYFAHNKIKFIGFTLFDGLTTLYKVNLSWNSCIDENYERNSNVIRMKKDIQNKCFNPNEFPPTTSPSTPTSIIEFISTLSEVLDKTDSKETNDMLKNSTTI